MTEIRPVAPAEAAATPFDTSADARGLLARYLDAFPTERDRQARLGRQLATDAAIGLRHNMAGHLTSGALVLSPDGRRVLLVEHVFLRRWLAPGGHYEAPGTLLDSALREVLEETGTPAQAHPWTCERGIPLDIDTHDIPTRPQKAEGPHVHHDFLFVAAANDRVPPRPQAGEVHAARWLPLQVLAEVDDERARRVHAKLKVLGLA